MLSEKEDLASRLSEVNDRVSEAHRNLHTCDAFGVECSQSSEWSDLLKDWRRFRALKEQIECKKKTLAPDIEIMHTFDAKVLKQQNENAALLTQIETAESTLRESKARLNECVSLLENAKSREISTKTQLSELHVSIQNNKRKQQVVRQDTAKMKKFSSIARVIDLLRQNNPKVLGMVCSICHPTNEVYTRAFLSVLGNRAYTSVVVADRHCGICVAKQLTDESLSDFAIEIANEYSISRIQRPSFPGAIQLMSVINVTEPLAIQLFENIFGTWVLCNNDINLDHLREHYKNVNVVCLDGRQYLSDGEIRLFCDSFFALSAEKSVFWPSVRLCDTYPSATDESKVEQINISTKELESEIDLLRSEISRLSSERYSLSNGCSSLQRSIHSMKLLIRTLPLCPIANVSKHIENVAALRILEDSLSDEEAYFRTKFGSLKFQDKYVVELLLQNDFLRNDYACLQNEKKYL